MTLRQIRLLPIVPTTLTLRFTRSLNPLAWDRAARQNDAGQEHARRVMV
jgi:hypothetical protein